MIPFKLPQLNLTLNDYMEIVDSQNMLSSSVGYIIGLGKEFFAEGTTEVDNKLIPMLTEDCIVNPRVVPSYAMLLWFAIKVSFI